MTAGRTDSVILIKNTAAREVDVCVHGKKCSIGRVFFSFFYLFSLVDEGKTALASCVFLNM